MRIVAADSGAAILNEKYEPVTVVAAASILTEPPYKMASSVLAEPIFVDANSGYNLIVHELELCQQLSILALFVMPSILVQTKITTI